MACIGNGGKQFFYLSVYCNTSFIKCKFTILIAFHVLNDWQTESTDKIKALAPNWWRSALFIKYLGFFEQSL